ncbi:Xyloglucan-specific endo-beta-1,4-glucanase BoGH5A (plasmid) [Asticcacaulis sp. MM231]|uniref:glycoside hydrolase family 5 protein n=1 Tax=Asticcacaulis sp. MM231 TaxID=3157666 RepID=UPI0032D56916
MKPSFDSNRRKLVIAAGISLLPLGGAVCGAASGGVVTRDDGGAGASSSSGGLYPSYNTRPKAADASGMTRSATEIAARIKLGLNIGNTLEAIGGETAWGNPLISQALIDTAKAKGFDAIRLPCSWNQYANAATAEISRTWLNRVKDVVQYCINADMYVVLNIHWDGGWLENNVTPAAKDGVIAKQRAFWEQIATHLRDYDERLVLASANEPNCETKQQMEVLYAYHQAFIDTVRSTGGRNAYRTLVLQAPNTSIDNAAALWYKMPVDSATNRLMTEVHFYTPFQFALMTEDQSWGKMFYYWGKDYHSTVEPDRNTIWGEEDNVDQQMAIVKRLFTDAGVPVILGEYGAIIRSTPKDLERHLASRVHWLKYVTQKALANGLLPFLWDTGGLIDRNTQAILDPRGLDAVLSGAGKI